MLALGASSADVVLREARKLFATMGYAPAVSETDVLLRRVVAKT